MSTIVYYPDKFTIDDTKYATTGSNNFNGNQVVTGNITLANAGNRFFGTASYAEVAGAANAVVVATIPQLISGSNSSYGLKVWQSGSGNSVVVQNESDASKSKAFYITNSGSVGIGKTQGSLPYIPNSNYILDIAGNTVMSGNLDITGALKVGPNPVSTITGEVLQLGKTGEALLRIYDGTKSVILGTATSAGVNAYVGTLLNHDFGIRANNTEYITVTSSNGFVGINTKNPAFRLDVSGDARITGSLIVTGTLTVNSNANIDLGTLYVDSTNNRVGIGTASPAYLLDASGDVRITGSLFVSGNTILGDNISDTTTLYAATMSIPNNLNINSNTLYINSTNNKIGILTNDPKVPLTIGTNPTSSNIGGELLQLGRTGEALLRIYDGTKSVILGSADIANAYVGTLSDHKFGIRANNAEIITVTGSGFVGINTTNPTYNLHVNGNASITNLSATNITASSISASTEAVFKKLSVNTTNRTADINTQGTFIHAGDIDPFVTNQYDIGASGNVWRTLHINSISSSRFDSNTASYTTYFGNAASCSLKIKNTSGTDGSFSSLGFSGGVDDKYLGAKITFIKQGGFTAPGDLLFSTKKNNAGTVDSDYCLPNLLLKGSTGDTHIYNNLIMSGNILIPTGKGITFSSGMLPGGVPETLDDYERGTWTPTFAADGGTQVNATYSFQYGLYTKIGNLVYVNAHLKATSFASTGSGNLYVSNLPFTCGNFFGTSDTFFSGISGKYINMGTYNYPFTCTIDDGTIDVSLRYSYGIPVPTSVLTNNAEIMLSIVYNTA